MKYGYVRWSTEAQNIARQMEEMYKLGLTDENPMVEYSYYFNERRDSND